MISRVLCYYAFYPFYCSWQEKRAKVTPTIETDQPSAPEVVAITPDDSVDIRHTFTSADCRYTARPVLPDSWNAQDAAAHLEKRSWLLIRDDGPLSIRRTVSCTLWVLTLKNGWSWSPAGIVPHFEPNCAFCDTSMKFCTRLV